MSDTIAAIATGGVISAIGIVRMSGDDVIQIVDRVFRSRCGTRLTDAISRKLYFGDLYGPDGSKIDECVCTISRGPSSYTGEDTAELQCHGSPVVLAEAMRSVIAQGARQAGPGEFTKRAFLNGRMDLSQAEAVIDLIESETVLAAKNAAGQLGGAIRVRAEEVYSTLLDIMSHFHAVLDYPDEDIDDFKMSGYVETLSSAENELTRLLATYERGRLLKDGVSAAIIGRPNVGKSSLLNTLLGYDRAIVTPIAGTTRDTIEEKVRLGDVLLRLVDTAGIRETDDAVEMLGTERARAAAESAALVLAVFDGSQPLTREDFEVFTTASNAARRIALINKADLPQQVTPSELGDVFDKIISISAHSGDGLPELEEAVASMLRSGPEIPAGEMLTNERQADAISRAHAAIAEARNAMEQGVTPDAALTGIEDALSAIGEVTGRTMREDVTARIFERFCVGK